MRFGEKSDRFYNANEQSIYESWAWGMETVDAPIDEILLFKKLPENYRDV